MRSLTFQVSWADEPEKEVSIEASSPYKAYIEFYKQVGMPDENEVIVTRAGKTDRFSNHVKNPEQFLKQHTERKKIEKEPVIWKNPDNPEEDLGCFLGMIVGAVMNPRGAILVIALLFWFFSSVPDWIDDLWQWIFGE